MHESRSADRLPLTWMLAWRFLRGRRTRLLNGTARAAIVATALGVTALVVTMALMTGYREGLQRKLISGNSAILIQPLSRSAESLEPEVLSRLESLPGVVDVGRVVYGRGMLDAGHGDAEAPVVLRGVDSGGHQLAARLEDLAPDERGVAGALLGSELARSLEVERGDVVRLVALGFDEERLRFRYRSLRVTGTFDTGFAEFDGEWVLLDRELLTSLLGERGALDLYEVALTDPEAAPRVAERMREIVGEEVLVTDWRELNQELFTALEVQQRILFLILGLIVLVSTFNVASTLVVLVRERMRDIGALAAMGLDPRRLRRTFLLYGAVLGATGTAVGVGLGAGLSWLLDRFELIRFNAEVAAIYFIRSVPFQVEASDVLAVVAFSLGVNLVACLVPSRWAASVEPADALRYE